jgi:ppGpp synthetase/RelA/SpoT-type nucleotidyltranferase
MSAKSVVDGAVDTYDDLRPRYQSLAETVRNILNHAIPDGCGVHSIEARAKDVVSFRRKAEKPDDTDHTKLKYSDPLSQITDLAGVRVITFFPKALKRICEAIEKEFDVTWMKDLGEERFAQGRFGYQSIHYLVKLPEKKTEWAEYKRFDGLIAEIQVRTILQHAWAEMEHDIQYKSSEQIPTSIQRRFVALAGMLEIADREFQAVQDEDAKLRQAVSASLQDDLTRTTITKAAIPGPDATQEKELTTSSTAASGPIPGWNPKKVRALVAFGKYDEAVALYSKMLEIEPGSYTLYIGRARAKFLTGDRSGAICDLDLAAKLHSDDVSINSLRAQIEEGVLLGPTSAADAWQLSSAGNEALSKGNGEEAFRLYSQAQELGFQPIFSTFNKAMACALIKDSDGATYFLDQFKPVLNSPTEVNSLALRAIVAAIAKTGFTSRFHALQSKLAQLSGFEISQSPLRHLESGFHARDTKPAPQVLSVFQALKKAD